MLHFLSLMRSFLAYQVTESAEEITEGETYQSYKYPNMVKTRTGFKLSVMKGSFNDSQIIVLLGENGTGKTTFIRMLVYPLVLQICFFRSDRRKMIMESLIFGFHLSIRRDK